MRTARIIIARTIPRIIPARMIARLTLTRTLARIITARILARITTARTLGITIIARMIIARIGATKKGEQALQWQLQHQE